MRLTDTVTLIEIVWTVPALVGVVLSFWMLWSIRRDHRLLLARGWNGLAALQVRHWHRSEMVALVVHVVFSLVGILALTQPGGAGSTTPSLLTLVITALFVFVPGLLMTRSVGDRIVRRVIRSEWQRGRGR